MKVGLRKIVASIASFAMALTSMSTTFVNVSAETTQTATEYEIYPTPHDIEYSSDEFTLPAQMNVVYEDGIDQATKNRVSSMFEAKGITLTVSNEVISGTQNVLVGVNGSGGAVDQYFTDNVAHDETLFDKIDAHIVSVDNGNIAILGKDSDAAFYGASSVRLVLQQLESNTIREFTIKDFANTKYRGFIEGYYGIPWSDEDRMSLMSFAGQFKANTYVFAPKDDEYHSAKWRELYPAERLEEMRQMVEVGTASKVNFVWTIHPFMHSGITAATFDADIEIIEAKFDQLYNIGIRQFGVLGDDVGNLPRQVVINTMNELQKWADAKGDVEDLIFCPGGYNHSWQGDYSELNEYDAGFDESIQIFWTGEAVCKPVENKTLDHFRFYNLPAGVEARRSPLFWINWPVNDVNIKRLVMGPGLRLYTDVNADNLSGVVTNPMQQAECSKTSLFAVADYTWNIAGFDAYKSWDDSFKYVEPDASEELHEIAKHLTDAAPNTHNLTAPESEELKPLLDAFKEKVENEEPIMESGNELIEQFHKLIKACEDFDKKSQNENLKEEINYWRKSLIDVSNASISYIQCAQAFELGKENEAWVNFANGNADLAQSASYKTLTISGTTPTVEAGFQQLVPFAKFMRDAMNPHIAAILDPSILFTSYITNRSDSPVSDPLSVVTDDSTATEIVYKSPNEITTGTYVGLKYNRPITLNDVTFKMGANSNANDTIHAGKLQYTEDGKNWIDLPGGEVTSANKNLITVEGLNLQIKGIRLIATADRTNTWFGVKDILVNASQNEGPVAETLTGTPFIDESAMEVHSGYGASIPAIADGDESTFGWFSSNLNSDNNTKDAVLPGHYVGLDFGSEKQVGIVKFVQDAGDKIPSMKGQYFDGTDWVDAVSLTDCGAINELDFGGVTTTKIRIYNVEKVTKWWKVYEISAKSYVETASNEFTYSNQEDLQKLSSSYEDHTYTLTVPSGKVLRPGNYVGLKLDAIRSVLTLEGPEGLEFAYNEHGTWFNKDALTSTYEKGTAMRYIRLKNNTDSDIDLSNMTFKAVWSDYEAPKVKSGNFSVDNVSYLFDRERTTEAIFNTSQYAGRNIVFDYGRTIPLESFKAVSFDSAGDFPRHGKISVSANNDNWIEIMTFGSQTEDNPGEADNTDNINDILPLHEISYNCKEVTGLDLLVRYIKFEVTRTKVGADKWVRFTEFELNGGNYAEKTTDSTVIMDAPILSANNEPTNIIDGDLTTSYYSTPESTKLTYRISDRYDYNALTILQNPKKISNAEVFVKYNENGEQKKEKIGALAQSLNQFVLPPKFDQSIDIEIVWPAGTEVEIYEIYRKKAEYAALDVAELQRLINHFSTISADEYTSASYGAAQKANDYANIVINSYVKQAQVDDAATALETAIESLRVKPVVNKTALEQALANAAKLDEKAYTTASWAEFQKVVDAAKAVNDSDESTQDEIDAAVTSIETATENLELRPPVDKAELEQAITNAGKLDQNAYTTSTWAELQKVVAAANIVKDNEEATQDEVNQATESIKKAMRALLQCGDARTLLELVASYANLLEEDYTTGSWAAYKDKLDDANEVIEKIDDKTQEQVVAAANALTAAKEALVSIKALKDKVNEVKDTDVADMTESTKTAFNEALKVANDTLAKADATADEIAKAVADLDATKDALVSTKALKDKVAEVKDTDLTGKTDESKATFEAALKAANDTLAKPDATNEEIAKAVEDLTTAFTGLEDKPVIVKPAKVTGLKVSKNTYSSVKLTWTKVKGATGYEITRSTKKDGTYGNKVTVKDVNTAIVNKLKTEQTYWFKIRAIKGDVKGDNCSAVSQTPTMNVAPVLASVTQKTYGTLQVTWKGVAGAQNYYLERRKVGDKNWKHLKTFPSKARTAESRSLNTGTKYEYRVRAGRYKGDVKSPYSNIKGNTPVMKTTTVTVTKKTATSAKVSWKTVSGASGYEVYRATSSTGKYTKIKTLKADEKSLVSKSLTKGKTYYYKVRAYRNINGKKVYNKFSKVVSYKVK